MLAASNELWVEMVIQLFKRSISHSSCPEGAKVLTGVALMRNAAWALKARFPHLTKTLVPTVPRQQTHYYDDQLAPTYLGGKGVLLQEAGNEQHAGWNTWGDTLKHLQGDEFAAWPEGWDIDMLEEGLETKQLVLYLHAWAVVRVCLVCCCSGSSACWPGLRCLHACCDMKALQAWQNAFAKT